MYFLVIGDPHFKENNPLESEEMVSKINLLLKQRKVDFIVCLGDVLDRHEKMHLLIHKRAMLFLQDLSNYCKTYVLVGNHDRPNNSNFYEEDHALFACKRWQGNLLVVDKAIKEGDFTFVPYVYAGKFMETLSSLPDWQKSKVIFAHQEFTGAKMGAKISEVEKWPEDAPYLISGHIHDYQRVQDNLLYVGTPIQHAFNENQRKTVSFFNIDEEGNITEERVDLGCKKKRTFHLSISELNSFVPPPNTIVKIIVSGKFAELTLAKKSAKVKQLKDLGIKISFALEEEKIPPLIKKEQGFYSTLAELVTDKREKEWMERIIKLNSS